MDMTPRLGTTLGVADRHVDGASEGLVTGGERGFDPERFQGAEHHGQEQREDAGLEGRRRCI
jgi:hypothetical protein